MRSKRVAAACAVGLAVASVLGCGRRAYERVEVVGVVTPVDHAPPAPGAQLQPLPPMPDLPIAPDTADGSVLAEVDQQRFWRDHGETMPAWTSPRPPAREQDLHLADFAHIVEDLRSVRALLDAVFAAPAEGGAATAATPSGDANRRAALLLRSQDWSAITARVIALGSAVDRLTAATLQPGPDGRQVEALDGDATLARTTDTLWAGTDAIAQALVATAQALATDGALAQLRHHPVHGEEVEGLLAPIRAEASATATVVQERQATQLIPHLRVLQLAIDRLEQSPIATLAFGLAHPAEPAVDQTQRDQSRLRLAAVRRQLVALAAQWAENNAHLLPHQPNPTLVYARAQDEPSR